MLIYTQYSLFRNLRKIIKRKYKKIYISYYYMKKAVLFIIKYKKNTEKTTPDKDSQPEMIA